MIPLEPTRNPEYAAAIDPFETAAADLAYLLQTWSEFGNPPEMVMRHGEMIPKLADYFDNAQSMQSDSAGIERSLVEYDPSAFTNVQEPQVALEEIKLFATLS